MTRLGVRKFAIPLPTRYNAWKLVELG
jgi:hypothetical protein